MDEKGFSVTNESGFTLIELIVIIVILGILAVTAVPKYIDMQHDARQGVADGFAGSLTGAAATNYGAYLLSTGGGTSTYDNLNNATTACTTQALLLLSDPAQLTTEYEVIAGVASVGPPAITAGDCDTNGPGSIAQCIVRHQTDTTAQSAFNIMCTD